MRTATLDDLRAIVQDLQHAEAFPHATGSFRVIETHISIVLLTGKYAYKLKKPVNLGFLDFSSAEKREYFCHEEVRLNRRLVPEIYLGVVDVTQGASGPEMGGVGSVLWHAVQMRQFPTECELDVLVPQGGLQRRHVDALAVDIARFHDQCPRSPRDARFGAPETVSHYVLECFEQTRCCVHGAYREKRFAAVQDWTIDALEKHSGLLVSRKRKGFVREVHGDLHLHNMLLLDDRVVPFDCLEFNAELRWIDVISDIAFLLMDLDYQGHPELAAAFLSGYLEHTGDYEGLRLLRLYKVYRAMVRTKVACIRETQELEAGEPAVAEDIEVNRHLDLAYSYLGVSGPRLIITCGLSGSGKSSLAAAILAPLGALRIRSDVERKRLAGIEPEDKREPAGIDSGLYGAEMTARTYMRLQELADIILANGWSVIVDAAFLRRSERDDFRELARRYAAPFTILYCRAPLPVLSERVQRRERRGDDVSEATEEVLRHQREFAELPGEDECQWLMEIDTNGAVDPAAIVARIGQA